MDLNKGLESKYIFVQMCAYPLPIILIFAAARVTTETLGNNTCRPKYSPAETSTFVPPRK